MTTQTTPTDLQTQLESLFHTVWQQEKQWQTEDRLDRSIHLAVSTARRQLGEKPGLQR